jgi:hypothetical protein
MSGSLGEAIRSENERALALVYLKRWMETRRE